VLGEPEAAAAAFARALALRPDDTEPAANRVLALLEAGDVASADAAWQELSPRLDAASATYQALNQALAKAREGAQ